MTQYTFERLQSEYAALWANMRVVKCKEASRQARIIIAHKDRYKSVESRTGVPWMVVGCLHMRESDADFTTWMHNGDPMKDRNGKPIRTRNVTKNRPLNPNCTWEDGAYDALVVCEHFDTITDWSPARVAYVSESFNGWGYRSPARNIPSPYLWGGTSVQKKGKFVKDGVYDKNVMDPQIGAMAVLQMLMALDQDAKFAPVSTPVTVADEADQDDEVVETAVSPKAIDTESQIKPEVKSKTIWGGLLTYGSGVMVTIKSFISELHDPYTLAAFIAILTVLSVGLFLVIKGRIDVNNIVKHLSGDDTEAK